MKIDIKGSFRKLSLVQKFSVAAVFLILVIMVIVNTLTITYQRRTLRSEMGKSHLLLVRNLSKDVMEYLIFTDPLRLDELVKTIAQVPECSYAAVTDQRGRFVAHTDHKLLGQSLPGEMEGLSRGVMGRGEEYVREISEDGLKEMLVPVKAGDDVVGMVMVGFSLNDIDMVIENNLKGLKRYILIISGAVLLLAIWGAFGLARFLTTPVKRLKDKMELVQGGDLDVEVPNEYLLNCWQALGCEAQECPAYGKLRCWTVSGTLCYGQMQGDVSQKIALCKKCVVYRESCGDEIGELIEVFNQMVKKLRGSIRELEEASMERSRLEKLSALGEMSMTVAHEIKNPLNAIRGAVSYLQENFQGEVLREFHAIIEEETKRLNEIVTSFLRFSKPTPLRMDVADINALVADTVELIRQEATENNIEVITSLDDRIPNFTFDPQQVKQAILNILVNALDATDSGQTIRIATSTSDSSVRVTITDTGEGMSEEVISEIFKPFFTTKTRGSGLGLACVERIVKDHRGDISVRSLIGKGTEFIIILPVGN